MSTSQATTSSIGRRISMPLYIQQVLMPNVSASQRIIPRSRSLLVLQSSPLLSFRRESVFEDGPDPTSISTAMPHMQVATYRHLRPDSGLVYPPDANASFIRVTISPVNIPTPSHWLAMISSCGKSARTWNLTFAIHQPLLWCRRIWRESDQTLNVFRRHSY